MLPERNVYAELGVQTIVNAETTLTTLGSPCTDGRVVEAMAAAARGYVDLHQLHRRARERLAELTRNDAALVTSGVAAGLTLVALALIQRGGVEPPARPPGGAHILVQAPHANPYLPALLLGGATVELVGEPEHVGGEALGSALWRRPLALLHVANGDWQRGALPYQTAVSLAQRAGIPVIVDAAAQLPPVENLWRFTETGASVALFSGGKGLAGPAGSGLVVGSGPLVERMAKLASPHHGLGRGFKVSKEEIIGLITAVEVFLQRDHDADRRRIEDVTQMWIEALRELPGVQAERAFPGEAGRPTPRARITLTSELALDAFTLRKLLLEGDPAIAVGVDGERALLLNAECLEPGQDQVVLDGIQRALQRLIELEVAR